MMIDGGDGRASTEKTVLRYLNALKIDAIDYLVVTHADSDHCGSLDKVLKYKKVVNAYLPLSTPDNDSEYAQFYAALLRKEISYIYTTRQLPNVCSGSETYPYQVSFLYPYGADKEEIIDKGNFIDSQKENDYSAVIWLDYFGCRALFTGDAPRAVEEKLVRDAQSGLLDERTVDLSSTEILKVAHHGSEDATSAAFLNYLNAKTAVISCGAKNSYGHPTTAVLNRLNEQNVDVYRTDFKGHVTVTMKANGEYGVRTHK
jgi:competence protein ComEC